MPDKNLWQAVLAQIELDLTPAKFATWFKSTKAQKEGKKIVISVPNSFVKEWLEGKYSEKIKKIVRSLDEEIRRIEFNIDKDLVTRVDPSPPERDDRQETLEVFKKDQNTGLNKNYTFNNFVVGGFNELAHAAALAVAEEPGSRYNPLFLYGRVGLGKTHLLQAIGNRVVKDNPRLKIRYIASENFTSDIILAIRNGTISSLKDKFRQIDILVIDDIQFIAGKEKTQEEFFHIFNSLYQKNKQIILSSDRPPKSISSLAKRLRSRFEGGMTADIGYPDLETRMAILKTKSQERGSDLPDDVCEYLAQNIETNIRELEGALNRIIFFKKVRTEDPDLEKIKELVSDFTVGRQEKLTPEKILEGVSDYYNIDKGKIISSSRKKEIVKPRQVAMFLMRRELESSYPAIGKEMGGRDHTTAMYSCNKIEDNLEKDDNLKKDISVIKVKFLSV